MYTFTKDPQKTKDVTNKFLYEYIKKQLKRTPLQIIEAHIAQEGDDKDKHVHWHVAIQTTKPLRKDRFAYYTQKYGNIDPSKSKINSISESLNYISKDSTPVRVV